MTKLGPVTSTSNTSAPNERNAFAIPAPVASETARSEPGPPFSTAILLRVRVIMASRSKKCCHSFCHSERSRACSCFLPHDLHFGFELDPPLFSRDGLNLRD